MAIDPESTEAARQKTAALLAQLWQKNLPVLAERVAVLRRAQQQIAAGDLTATLRAEALSVAHKMAGSLGMFGLPAATDAARQLEILLGAGEPDAAAFARHLLQLEASISSRNS
jgi:HPt (histidine-containing phosphotransfer) domain-containing protein